MKTNARVVQVTFQSFKSLRRLGSLLGVMMLLSDAATAQSASVSPKLEIYIGYAFLYNHTFDGSNPASGSPIGWSGNHGYDLRFTYNRSDLLGFEADFAGNHGSSDPYSSTVEGGIVSGTITSHMNEDFNTFFFGPKLTRRAGGFHPYAHFLAGVAHGHAGIIETRSVTIPEGYIGGPDVITSNLSSSGKETGFGFAIGGGFDWVHGRWALKILEANLVVAPSNGDVNSTANQTCASTGSACGVSLAATERGSVIPSGVRLTTGILFRFGRR